MSSDQQRPGPKLSIVKPQAIDPLQGYIALEAMTHQQSDLVKRTLQSSNISGLLAGMVKGDAVWDVRPVVVERGIMSVLRLADPALNSSPKEQAEFQSLAHQLTEAGLIIDSRTIGDSFWVRRAFTQYCLSTVKSLPDTPVSFLKKLVEKIKELHLQGIIHGHISPANIGLQNNEIVLLDIGFCGYSPTARSRRNDIAPELKAGFRASTATDIYGVGVVISEFVRRYKGRLDKLEPTVRALLNPDPVGRPSIDWVHEQLASSSQAQKAPIARGQVINPNQQAALPWIRNNLIGVGVTVGLIGTLLFFVIQPKKEELPYEAYWLSGQPSFMNKVAVAAVRDDDFDAQSVIIDQVLEGKNYPSVLNSVLKIAFDKRWIEELTQEDRGVALQVALGPLLPKSLQRFDLNKVSHPAIFLALAGSVNINSKGDQFSAIKLERLGSLPDPYGEAFAKLAELGTKSLEHPTAKGLAHILVGDRSSEALAAFLVDDTAIAEPLERLKIIAPLFVGDEKLSSLLASTISRSNSLYKKIFAWFESDSLGLWKGVSGQEKLLLGLGVMPKTLTLEQNAELLVFQNTAVRENAAKNIKDLWPEISNNLLITLATSKNPLMPAQIAALITALKLKPEAQGTFMTKWFEAVPNQDAIAELLIQTRNDKGLSSFHLESSRYLAEYVNEILLSTKQLEELAAHPEPLARALAYRKLKPSVKEEREILEKSATVEPIARMREQIQQRLAE